MPSDGETRQKNVYFKHGVVMICLVASHDTEVCIINAYDFSRKCTKPFNPIVAFRSQRVVPRNVRSRISVLFDVFFFPHRRFEFVRQPLFVCGRFTGNFSVRREFRVVFCQKNLNCTYNQRFKREKRGGNPVTIISRCTYMKCYTYDIA
jgi:hypothetical protein